MYKNFQKINFYTKNIPLNKICFLLIIFTFVGFTLSYSLLTPTFEGPDEDIHYRYSIWLFNPELRPDLTFDLYNSVGQPLYYIVNSIFFNLLDPDDQYVNGLGVTHVYPIEDKNRFQHGPEEIFPYSDIAATIHTLRLLSIAFGVITLIFVYKIAKLVFSTNRWLPLYVTAFVSLIPTFLSINAVLNSDVLLWTLSTITLFFLFKFVNEPKRNKFVILTAIFATLAISTKANGLVFIPIFLSVITYLFISKQIRIKVLFRHLFLYSIFSVISVSWLWVYRALTNVVYSNESPLNLALGTSSLNVIGGIPGLVSPEEFGNILHSRITDLEFIHTRFVEFTAGGFWWNVIWLPKIYYVVIDIFLIISVIGLAVFLIKKQNIIPKLELKKNHLFILSSAILIPLSFLYVNFMNTEIGIARYYFPIISMLGIVIPLGWYTFVYNKKNLRFMMLFPLVFLILLNIQVLTIMEEEQNIIEFLDIDNDGITDTLDPDFNVSSNEFNDSFYGGNNFGTINSPFHLSTPTKFPPLLITPDLGLDAIKIKDLVDYAPLPVNVNLCGKTSIWVAMGDEVVFSCDDNDVNIIEHSIFLKDLPEGIYEGDLIQGENLSEVYLIEYKTKRHIATIEAFESHGYTLDMIKYVPDEIVNEIYEGYPISD